MSDARSSAPDLDETTIATILADDLAIKGTLKFSTSLMIKGSLEGDIISEGLLVVSSTAKLTATITTKDLISYGEIQGDVTATGKVVLKGSAVQSGNITTPTIEIETGSVMNGSLIMKR